MREVMNNKVDKKNNDTRSILREQIFQIFFSDEFETITDEILEMIIENYEIASVDKKLKIQNLLKLKHEKEEELIEYIKKYLTSQWKFERLNKIKIAIIKLSILEIKYNKVPYKVAINEALELAKKYDEEGSSNFVNGILASFVKNEIEA